MKEVNIHILWSVIQKITLLTLLSFSYDTFMWYQQLCYILWASRKKKYGYTFVYLFHSFCINLFIYYLLLISQSISFNIFSIQLSCHLAWTNPFGLLNIMRIFRMIDWSVYYFQFSMVRQILTLWRFGYTATSFPNVPFQNLSLK